MQAARNVDDILYKVEAEQMGTLVENEPKEAESAPVENDEMDSQDITQEASEEINEPEKAEKKEVESKKEEAHSENIDEYGNELPKPRMYSEEEVNRMMRERFSRGSFAQQQQYEQNQAQQQAIKDFKADPNSDDSWEVQLEQFVENTINKRVQRETQQAQQLREQQVQAEFETKFTTGMSRYQDFQQIVSNQPITDSMMMAMRGMSDPAAFVYAAAKNHAKELQRISQIQDPFQQGAEIGKLEERMKKARAVTSATKPLPKTVGDMVNVKVESKKSIDDLIRIHAKQKYRR